MKIVGGKVYDVCVVFKLSQQEGTNLPRPCSKCSCPNGSMLCAHMGALFMLLSVFQVRPSQGGSMQRQKRDDYLSACVGENQGYPRQ